MPLAAAADQLSSGQWFAMQLWRPNEPGISHACVVRILDVFPQHTGHDLLELEFFQINPGDGVHERHYRLEILVREPHLLIARRFGDGATGEILALFPLRLGWLRHSCANLLTQADNDDDLHAVLETEYGRETQSA